MRVKKMYVPKHIFFNCVVKLLQKLERTANTHLSRYARPHQENI